MDRRDFLRASAFASVGLMTGASSAPAEIEITPQDTGPEISPHIYGQFIEHLGGVIYDGIWVGRNSKIPNIDGIRKQFVDDLKRIAVPNFRWPGGCFADGYHWRDGIGDPSRRPRTYNYWQASMPQGLDDTEPNHFGIHEFMNLCRLSGAEPYLAANMGSGSPQEFHDWVSYANAPVGTVSLANERAMNGSKEPFGVRFWGVGNESWGCGGDMTPQEYASLYRRFVTQFPAFPPKPFFIAVGPRGHSKDLDLGWTNGFFEAMQGHRTRVDGLSIHYYTDFRNSPEKVSTFDARGWYDVISRGPAHRNRHRAALGRNGQVRSRSPHQTYRGRVGRLVSPRRRDHPGVHTQPAADAPRRAAHSRHIRCLQSARRQNRNGKCGPDDQLHPLSFPRAGRSFRAHPGLLRLRDVSQPHAIEARRNEHPR